jgi:hypothetical protein
MAKIQNNDTRYFIEIDLQSLKIMRCGFDDKWSINKGRQVDPAMHRLFLTPGQYRKFVSRCAEELSNIIDT